MVSNKKDPKNNLSEIHSDRSTSINKRDKSIEKPKDKFNDKGIVVVKKKPALNTNIIDDFQCNEELELKPLKTNSNTALISHTSTHINRIDRDKKFHDKKQVIPQPVVIINYKEEIKKF